MSLISSFTLTPHEPAKQAANTFLVYVRAFGAYIHPWTSTYGLPGSLTQQYNGNAILIKFDSVVQAGDYNIREYFKHSTFHMRLYTYDGIPEGAELLFVIKLKAPVFSPPQNTKVQIFVGADVIDEEEWAGGEKNIPIVFDRPINPNYVDIFIREVTGKGICFLKADGFII